MSGHPDASTRSVLINRELSWIAFNQRVLEEALDATNPLLERVKFFCIANTNLDEYFEVRVAGLREQVTAGVADRSPDGWTPHETLRAVRAGIRTQVDQIYACWRERLVPELAERGIRFPKVRDLNETELGWLSSYYEGLIHPVITPLAIDQSHPFPLLRNRTLYVVVQLIDRTQERAVEKLGVVQVPENVARLVQVPGDTEGARFLFLGRIIGHFMDRLYPGMEIRGNWYMRVTRNGELYIDTEESETLLLAVERELQNRLKGQAVRLEVSHNCPSEVCDLLLNKLGLEANDLYHIDGPLHPGRIMRIADDLAMPALRDAPFVAPMAPALRRHPDPFSAIRQRDILLHHPYESFDVVAEFLEAAAADPAVLAIKQTLYRTGGDPRIIEALREAALSDKQVTAIVELKARFDEHNNIKWARELEKAGVHVVYGLLGYKIHSKLTLVVRNEKDGIRRYVHVATGNYNATTAKIYTDLGLLTCRPDFGEDATQLFNLLTGICQFQPMRRFAVAPFELHERVLDLIANEAENAMKGLPARIIAKMNSLVDPATIHALYDASRKGVSIDLIVRGICCLRPGVPGLSDNIRVRSIVDRFLEHSRVYYFENASRPLVFLGSADWMPRNFFSRIEVVFPIEDGNLRERLVQEVLEANLHDNARARLLQPDGTYVRAVPERGERSRRAQTELLAAARRAAEVEEVSPDLPSRPARSNRHSRFVRVAVRRRPEGP